MRILNRPSGPLLLGCLAGFATLLIGAPGVCCLWRFALAAQRGAMQRAAGAIPLAGDAALAAIALLALLAGVVVFRLSLAAAQSRSGELLAQQRLAEAKQQADSQAQHAAAAAQNRSEFLAVMTHELRTPMNGVQGFAKMLLETPLNPEQREFAKMVQRSSDALLVIINDVLDYSKIEAGRMCVESIDVDLRLICEEVRIILQSALGARDLGIAVSYESDLPRFIKGDPVRIRQVLLNLAGNAVKFTETGTVRIEVSLMDHALKVSVMDNGMGNSEEQPERLFMHFTQGESTTATRPGSAATRRYDGIGLGLAISKTLVGLMGGSIGAESRPDQGSTFWFTLPLGHAVPQAQPPQSDEHPVLPNPEGVQAAQLRSLPSASIPVLTAVVEPRRAAPAPGAARSGIRLLLVEDNFVNQRVAVYMLSKLGHQVDVAKHGRDAIEKLSKTHYDLVFMDCQMPEMDGFETTRIIRDPNSGVLDHTVPVIAITANAFPDDRARALACGMNDFLTKPVDRGVLTSTLAKWLEAAPRRATG